MLLNNCAWIKKRYCSLISVLVKTIFCPFFIVLAYFLFFDFSVHWGGVFNFDVTDGSGLCQVSAKN